MAVSGHIVYGRVKGGQSVLDVGFASQTVVAGSAAITANTQYNYCAVTAIEGPIWIAFSQSGTANAAQNPREYLSTNQKITFSYRGATSVDIDAA